MGLGKAGVLRLNWIALVVNRKTKALIYFDVVENSFNEISFKV